MELKVYFCLLLVGHRFSLAERSQYIDQHKHLPEVPTASDVEKNGVSLGEMNATLLKKVEELTLYVIELEKQNQKQDSMIRALQK